MKNLEIMQVKINEILNKAKQEAENLQSQIDTANKAKEDAAAAFIEAKHAGDPKAYAEASADQRAYKDIAELYAHKKEAHDKRTLITVDEYKAMIDQIMSELDQANDAAKEKVLDHIEALKEIAGEISQTIHFGNELLHQVQHELFKDDAYSTSANGVRFYHHTNEKEYKKYDLIYLLNEIIEKCKFMGGK